MTIKDIWNSITIKQRTDLLKSIYGASWVGFHRDIPNGWDSLPYGLQCRLQRLDNVRTGAWRA